MNDANDILDSDDRGLTCPKCGAPMEKIHFDAYPIARCTSCRGLFMDAAAHERLESMDGSECIDTGQEHAEDYDQTVRINCPACHTRMIRMVDHNQPYICGSLVADSFRFSGNAGGTVDGSVIALKDVPFTASGNSPFMIGTPVSNNPTGITFPGGYGPIPGSYTEVR